MEYSLYHKKWITGQYQPKVAAYYYREWENYHMIFHRHDQVEIMYVIKGKCTVETTDQAFSLTKGDFILLDAGEAHRLMVEEGSPCRMLNIEFQFAAKNNPCPSLRDLYQTVPGFPELLSSARPYIVLKDPDEIYPSLKNLIMELDRKHQGQQGQDVMIHLLLCQILLGISRLNQDAQGRESLTGSIHIRRAVSYLHQHYDQDIKISRLASMLHIQEGYLYRIFRKHMGVTPNEYLTRLRMEKAEMLLARTDIPIIEISGYVGINSRQYFAFLFKKHTSMTPSEYRKLARKSEIQKN
jgi:AraC-like DNA-binding protein